MKNTRVILVVSLAALVAGAVVSTGVLSLFEDRTQETLRLLRRSEKIEHKQTGMRGTIPLNEREMKP